MPRCIPRCSTHPTELGLRTLMQERSNMRRVCDGVLAGLYVTVVAAVPLLFLMLIFVASWEWNREVHGTASDEWKLQENRRIFYDSLFQTLVIAASQLPALLIANTILALRRIVVTARHGAHTGAVLFLMNCLLLSIRIFPGGVIGSALYFLALPTIGVTIPFFWQSRRSGCA